jgi:retron-type reverse transcriptase
LDIRSFFPTVDHRVLLDLLAPRIRDERIHHLLRVILESGRRLYARPKMREFYGLGKDSGTARGLPIGNLTSQWWGNLYLNGLDHLIKRDLKVKGYLRYMDDMVLFGDDRGVLRSQYTQIEDWLLDQRGLSLKDGLITKANRPITFLGYRVSPAGIAPHPKMMRRFKRNLVDLADDPARLETFLTSWKGILAPC